MFQLQAKRRRFADGDRDVHRGAAILDHRDQRLTPCVGGCGAGRAILLRMAPGMWKLVPPSGVQTELTNDSFSATVAELLE